MRLSVDIEVSRLTTRLRLESESRLISLSGASGIGKSTLVGAIAGVVQARGSIRVLGERWLDGAVAVPAHERGAAWVPQDARLFPHLNVRGNLAFGPNCDESDVARVAALLEIDTLLDRRPKALSGGEKQRVAIGRALLARPRFLLLDESFNAMDRPLRSRVRDRLFETAAAGSLPIFWVTHDSPFALEAGFEGWELDSEGLRPL